MSSTINSSFAGAQEARPAHTRDWRLGIPTYVYAVVFSSLCIVWGLLWDIMWHMSIGRDGLFSAPHLLIYVGAVVSGLFSGYQVLKLTFQKSNPQRVESVRFWGVFYGSLGAMYCVWGALAMITSAPFDDWWHNTYGLDVQILTPPHTILILGMMMVQFGAMIGVLALQNRLRDQPGVESKAQFARAQVLFGISSGLLLTVLYTLVSEELGDYASHNSSFYVIAAVIFPIYLMAVGRASLLRYPITITTAVYMAALLIPNWILPLFPATPKLGPVLNPITHYQPFVFPLLLVIPGFALDKLMHRFNNAKNRGTDWVLSAVAGVTFVLLFLAVQWFFSGFLHTSPYARNWFFLTDSAPYASDPTWPYNHAWHPYFAQTAGKFWQGIGLAIVFAAVSARVGLWWGNWMKRVQR